MEPYTPITHFKRHKGLFKTIYLIIFLLTALSRTQAANVTGSVWDDANGNAVHVGGTNEPFVNGTTYPLWANLVDVSSNQVIAINKVNTVGDFTLTGATNSAVYNIILTTTQQVIGTVLTASTLPVGWIYTGINTSINAGLAANADITNKTGVWTITIPASGNLANRNFGIERLPGAASVTAAAQQNPRGNSRVPVITPNAIDAEDGNLWTTGTGTIQIETLPSNGTLYYNGTLATAGQTINNFIRAQLTIDPDDGAVTTSFTYSSIDDAGQKSATMGTVVMPFTEPTPFICDSYFYQVVDVGSGSTLYRYNPLTSTRTSIAFLGGPSVNSIGYNTLDNLIWGWDVSNNKVIRIDALGQTTSFTIPNMPANGYHIGEVLPGGYLYLTHGSSPKLYVVDINPGRSTYLQLVEPNNGYILDASPYGINLTVLISDWAYNPATGLLYGLIDAGATNQFKIITVNPTTLAISVSATAVSGGAITSNTSSAGAVFFDKDGYFYVFHNSLAKYYRIDLNTNAATRLSGGSNSGLNDGASCPTAAPFQADLGDAPDAYGTYLNSGGPSHVLSSNLKIGLNVDGEMDALPALPNAVSNGDDLNGAPDDEDGMTLIPQLKIAATTYSLTVKVTNTTGTVATLSGWVDFNRDNVFDLSERTQVVVPNGATSAVLNWAGLSGLVAGQSYIRLRLASVASEVANPMGDAGSAANGEVEDYRVTIDGGPDVTPRITVVPGIVHGTQQLEIVVAVQEVGTVAATTGQITVRVAKNPLLSNFIWNQTQATAPANGNISVQNSIWTASQTDPNYYIFTTTTSIPKSSQRRLAFYVTLNPGGGDGSFPLPTTIPAGQGGGELNLLNNQDADLIQFFAN